MKQPSCNLPPRRRAPLTTRPPLIRLLAASALALASAAASAQGIAVNGGTLTWTLTETTRSCYNTIGHDTLYYPYYAFYPITLTVGGVGYPLGSAAYWQAIPNCQLAGSPASVNFTYFPPSEECTINFVPEPGYASATGSCTPLSTTTFDMLYKVASILYSPPGNQSSQGYAEGTTNGTTTTIGNSFSVAKEITFQAGNPDVFTAGGSFGYTTSTGNSTAFTQTWTDVTSVVSRDNNSSFYNPSASNALNSNLDTFEIWLNPQITVASDGTNPVSYTANSQPIILDGESVQVADVLPVPAISMEAQPAGPGCMSNPDSCMNPAGVAGVSGVAIGNLVPVANPQESGVNVYQPGLGAICANPTLYSEQLAADNADPQNPAQVCTQANQCGCQPSDFVTIEEADFLLNYNPSTYTANPGDGTTTPLAADALPTTSGPGSGEATCGYDQPDGYLIPADSNCRYVIVPQPGTNVPIEEQLNGAQSQAYSTSDSTNSTFTTTASHSYNVGVFSGGGILFGSLKTSETWTWTDSEGIGTSTGGTNSMNVNLQTTTGGCEENVSLYEDTIYHTFAFQIPTGIADCP